MSGSAPPPSHSCLDCLEESTLSCLSVNLLSSPSVAVPPPTHPAVYEPPIILFCSCNAHSYPSYPCLFQPATEPMSQEIDSLKCFKVTKSGFLILLW